MVENITIVVGIFASVFAVVTIIQATWNFRISKKISELKGRFATEPYEVAQLQRDVGEIKRVTSALVESVDELEQRISSH